MEKCTICGNEYDIVELFTSSECHVCDDCIQDNNLVYCRECEEYHSINDSYYDEYYDNYVCANCYEANDMVTCEVCGEIMYFDDAIFCSSNNGYYCQAHANSHLAQCDDCGCFVEVEDAVSDYHTALCECCFNSHYYTCDECGDIVHYQDVIEDGGCYYCQDCGKQYKGIIKNYSYKPEAIFYGEDSNLYLGVELEVDRKDNIDNCELEGIAQNVIEDLSHVYTKHDGSLKCGFEIVTHPATLQYHSKVDYQSTFKELVSSGMLSHDTETCGFHVHVNRDYFNNSIEVIGKIIFILEKFKKEFTNFSRRTADKMKQWAEFYEVEVNEKNDYYSIYETCKCRNNYDRYFSLNLQNSKTIEFRIFRGTLKYSTFLATLQLVSNVVNVAKNVEDINTITFKDIVQYVQYKELIEYCTKRNLL